MKTAMYTLSDTDLLTDENSKRYTLRLRDMPAEEKPREKLLKYGPEVLDTSELLAIILNTGTKKEEVLAMTRRILKEYGEKSIAHQTNAEKIVEELDVSEAKACQIVATFELGRRFFKEGTGRAITIRTAAQAYEYLKDMGSLPKEHLRGLYLNSRYRLIHDEVISIGSVTSNIVHPREVFKPALEYSASAVIIAHNHPSGDSKASSEDILITKQLVEAGNIVGIDLLDHIIITKHGFASVPARYTE